MSLALLFFPRCRHRSKQQRRNRMLSIYITQQTINLRLCEEGNTFDASNVKKYNSQASPRVFQLLKTRDYTHTDLRMAIVYMFTQTCTHTDASLLLYGDRIDPT